MTSALPLTAPAGLVSDHAVAAHRVGPNAIIQLGAALRDRLGEEAAQRVFAGAGLQHMLADPPQDMVDQHHVAALNGALFDLLPAADARSLAAEAGRRTGNYILAHRIPGPAQAVLKALPPRFAARLLLRAIARSAWTFAGSGHFSYRPGSPSILEIDANPLAMPGCVWHVAVFERLFSELVAKTVAVTHTQCCRDGAPRCRFIVDLDGQRHGAK